MKRKLFSIMITIMLLFCSCKNTKKPSGIYTLVDCDFALSYYEFINDEIVYWYTESDLGISDATCEYTMTELDHNIFMLSLEGIDCKGMYVEENVIYNFNDETIIDDLLIYKK